MKILVIEDEKDLSDMMTATLRKAGFICENAEDLSSALEKINLYEYDCIVLDIMLPDGSGLDILKAVSEKGGAERVIITSAKGSVEDKIKGLELGADDYLPKPFHLGELLARVKSLIRRNNGTGNTLRIGNTAINITDRSATVNGKGIALLNKEYRILEYFISRPGRTVDKQTLAEAVWGDNADQSDNFNFVYQQVANLKRKLKDAGSDISILAIYGFGYKLAQNEEI